MAKSGLIVEGIHPMNLNLEFRNALLAGATQEELKEIVLRYKTSGGTQRDAYDHLHELWLELGFDEDESDAPNPQRDELEYVMEIVWGFCSSDKALWEKSLSS
jgi:hypothetical protein